MSQIYAMELVKKELNKEKYKEVLTLFKNSPFVVNNDLNNPKDFDDYMVIFDKIPEKESLTVKLFIPMLLYDPIKETVTEGNVLVDIDFTPNSIRLSSELIPRYISYYKNPEFTHASVKKNRESLTELFKKMVELVKPTRAFAGVDMEPFVEQIEYNQNIYWFIPEFDGVEPDGPAIKMIKQAEDKISEQDLLSILRSKSYNVIEFDKGIAIIRDDPGSSKSYVYPRYFLRKALREGGVTFKDGKAEQEAKELGIQ